MWVRFWVSGGGVGGRSAIHMTFSLTHTLHPNPTLWRSQVLVSARLAVDIHEIVRRQTEVDVQTIHVPNQVTDKSSPLESRTFRLYDRGECELFASELMSLVLTVGGYDDPLPNFLDFMRGAGACGLSVCLCVCLCVCVRGGSGIRARRFHFSPFLLHLHPASGVDGKATPDPVMQARADDILGSVWRCAAGILVRGPLGDPTAWPSRSPAQGQMELAVLRVVEMMGNDNFFRRQGMICMAEPFARLLAGSPYFLRSKYCVGSESITLHLMDQEPIVAPTYTMQVRAWLSLSLSLPL